MPAYYCAKQKVLDMKKALIVWGIMLASAPAHSQVDESKLGAWYMYFWNARIQEKTIGFQGDIQYRNWNILGDLEQLLLRGGVTYTTRNKEAVFTLGYAHVISQPYGENNTSVSESRIYQEALLPQKIGNRVHIFHRFRYEQRFVQNQDFRTRWRYFLNIAVPFNQTGLSKGALYAAAYSEVFLNGQRDIGNGNSVAIYDRARLYGALGYGLTDKLRLQAGYMQQITDNWSKGQLQVSLHQSF